MRILLVNPPNCGRSIPEEIYGISSIKMILRGEPLSLETLAGNLTDHDVRIADLKALPDSFDNILADFRPEIVGITGVTCEANTMLKLAETARKISGAIIVAGGAHASNDPAFFNCELIDYVVIGLGKKSFPELINRLQEGKQTSKIPGVVKTNPSQEVFCVPRNYSRDDLVEDKPPRYDLTAQFRREYTMHPYGFSLGLVATAFGCPHRCSFCSIEPITGGRYLTHDPKTILRDIRLVGETPLIRLVDANTFGSAAQSRELCREIMDSGLQKQYVADVRSDTVVKYPELFKDWAKAGLRTAIIGFEEIDDKKLESMKKENTTAVNTEAIRILHNTGITIIGDFIISPDYEEAQFQLLRDYLAKNPIDLPMFSVLTPLPGTPLYNSMKDMIAIHDLDYYTLTNAVVPTRMDEKIFYENYADLMKSGHAEAKL